ncbi:MAG: TetR/AcrR family transcriptional regulator [Acidimicrobiales bacterium]|nr:TetR/AcrR family transcriptional regulator [Acidimicrobiales bacterium]
MSERTGERVVSDEELLDAALEAFARDGFAGTSVREVARTLGVSHNLIPQRFGSKERLWYAAVDHGFSRLLADLLPLATEPFPDDVARLRAWMVRFVEANAARPALLRIINREAAAPGPRLDYLFERYIKPVGELGAQLLADLHRRGEVATTSVALVYFLLTHGAGGPTTFPALAERFGEPVEPGDPAAVRHHARAAVDVLFDGLRGRHPAAE